MTGRKRNHFPWMGIILILIGGAMLFDHLGVMRIEFSFILWSLVMIFGIAAVGRGFSRNSSGKIFFGTILFLYGLYFLLRATEYVELRGHMFIPATFIIVGFAFVMIYINNVREWAFLIPALLLMGLGAAYLLSETGFLYPWELREIVRMYWPVGVILIGIAILFRHRMSIRKEPPIVPPPPSTAQEIK